MDMARSVLLHNLVYKEILSTVYFLETKSYSRMRFKIQLLLLYMFTTVQKVEQYPLDYTVIVRRLEGFNSTEFNDLFYGMG